MKQAFIFALLFVASTAGKAQSLPSWAEQDREFLLENLKRTREEVIKETTNLTDNQWSYKEDSLHWSIAQVLEHLGLYERLFIQEADIMLSATPDPQLARFDQPDTVYINWMNDPNPHHAEWNAEPLGLMKGSDNLTFFLFGRNHLISYIQRTNYDLKKYYTYRWGEEQRRSIHGLMVVHFANTDRHLKQIKRIKFYHG